MCLNNLAMKKSTLLFLISFFLIGWANGQEKQGWIPSMQTIQFVADEKEQASMSVDGGYKFADLEYKGRNYRIFFNRDQAIFKKARIVDQDSKLEIARGRGNINGGSGRLEFIDGEVLKLKRKNNPNGYNIIGPYGILFEVKNHGISPVKALVEKDFLAQAFFVFERIKSTQSPPSGNIIIINSAYTYHP